MWNVVSSSKPICEIAAGSFAGSAFFAAAFFDVSHLVNRGSERNVVSDCGT